MFLPEKLEFFQPTTEMRTLEILQMINENSSISQAQLSSMVKIVPSMVNRYIDELYKRDLINKVGGIRNMQYHLTEKGMMELQCLTLSYLKEVAGLYTFTSSSFTDVFDKLLGKKNIVLYGAGVIGEMVSELLKSQGIFVSAFVDDFKSGHIDGVNIVGLGEIYNGMYDAIIVTSFKNEKLITRKLLEKGYKNVYAFEIVGKRAVLEWKS